MDAYSLVLSTCPDAASATRLAEGLVEARLAACVNILPHVCSVYRWEGRIVQDNEHLLLIKTCSSAVPAVREFLIARHPYAIAEVIAVPIADGSPAYFDWMRTCLSGES